MILMERSRKKLICSEAVAEIVRPLLAQEDAVDQEKEHFWAIGLTSANCVKYLELVSLGSLTQTLVHPREVFRRAVSYGVAGLIVAHNHPGGNPDPSPEDRALTARLIRAGQVLGIPLLDHVVLGEEKHYSFADHQELC